MYQSKLHSDFDFDTPSWNLDGISIRSPLSFSGTLLSSVIPFIKIKIKASVYQIVSHNEVYTLDDMSNKLVTKFVNSVRNLHAQNALCKVNL